MGIETIGCPSITLACAPGVKASIYPGFNCSALLLYHDRKMSRDSYLVERQDIEGWDGAEVHLNRNINELAFYKI